ncbi:group I truncated hemoglobin [Microbacterium cremeum]|uniref:group I truncated hemoglobin n=1 Tax=Microbacterium cremeum TaxID=2782169 RepID=UPI0018883E9A|nr:group 1 truncated hemoglobin [Microbacterium cremeum]
MSVYDEIGGAPAVKAAVTVFYERVTSDPELATWFQDVDLTRLKAHQRAFLAAALGGPELFTGRGLDAAHAHLGITSEAFDAVVEHLAVALHDLGTDDDVVARVRERLDALRGEVVTAVSA